ncbi:MAG: GNAT family N-acetyltransferase [Pseudomonadales bacterium]
MRVHVVTVPWSSHGSQLRAVRRKVLIEEQGAPAELERDGDDELGSHFLAVNEAGQPIGCARLLPSGQIGRMAVLASFRGRGIGRRLLDEAVEEAKRQGLTSVHLHALTEAEAFYRSAGFRPEGPQFQEAGIAHVNMVLALPIPYEAPADVPAPVIRDAGGLPTNTPDPVYELRHATGVGACLDALLTSLTQPRRHLQLLSQTLDHSLFDQPAVVDALSRFVRSGPPATLRVLVYDTSLMVSRGHRLLELARRLDSKIDIRRVPDELQTRDDSFATWDATGYWLMPDHRDYTCLCNAYDPVQAARFGEQFTYLWERSAADPDLRLLKL